LKGRIVTPQASWPEAPVTDPLDSTQATWDVYVSLRRQSQRLLLRKGQLRVIPSSRLTLWLDERADRPALADVAAAEGFPE